MSVSRYPEYKESGVEWIGTIPTHWTVDRLKRSVESCKNGLWGTEPTGGEDDLPCVRVADFDRLRLSVHLDQPTIRGVDEQERQGRLLGRGDLLLEKSGGGESQPVGCVVLYEDDRPAICSNFVARIQLAAGSDSSFWRYVHAAAYSIGLNVRSIKQTSGIQNLDQQQYFDERAAFPPFGEQVAIAAFLDRETAKIDALIAEQERLIELLNEKRQAVISHAVTKGLNPDAPMKPSGVEWLGNVPASWTVARIGSLFSEIAEAGHDDLPILSVSIHDGVSDKEISDEEMDRKVTRSEDRSKYIRVGPGDLVYNMMRAWQGGFGTVTVNGMVSPAYVVARPRRPLDTVFVEHILRTPMAIEQMRRFSKGVTDFRLRLYWDDFKNMQIAVPSAIETRTIVNYIRIETGRLSAIVDAAREAISRLKERRAALISAAVTGQIDVRG